MNEAMNCCVETCLNCYKICPTTAMNHCLVAGGKHVEPAHFRLMMGLCRNVQDVSALHADQYPAPQTRLPGVR
jgi:hypothetical protein